MPPLPFSPLFLEAVGEHHFQALVCAFTRPGTPLESQTAVPGPSQPTGQHAQLSFRGFACLLDIVFLRFLYVNVFILLRFSCCREPCCASEQFLSLSPSSRSQMPESRAPASAGSGERASRLAHCHPAAASAWQGELLFSSHPVHPGPHPCDLI